MLGVATMTEQQFKALHAELRRISIMLGALIGVALIAHWFF